MTSRAIDNDLYCAGCGYNLRTQNPDGRCPECGHDIRRTLDRQPQWQYAAWAREVRRGFDRMSGGAFLVLLAAIGGFMAAAASPLLGIFVGPFILVSSVMVHYFGVRRLTDAWPDRRSKLDLRLRIFGSMTILLAATPMFLLAIFIVFQPQAASSRAWTLLYNLAVIAGMILSMGTAAYIWEVGELISRFMQQSGAVRFAHWSRWHGRCLAAALGLTLLVVGCMLFVEINSPVPARSPFNDYLTPALSVGALASAAGFVTGAAGLFMMSAWVARRQDRAIY